MTIKCESRIVRITGSTEKNFNPYDRTVYDISVGEKIVLRDLGHQVAMNSIDAMNAAFEAGKVCGERNLGREIFEMLPINSHIEN